MTPVKSWSSLRNPKWIVSDVMLHSYSFVGTKNGETFVKTHHTSLAAIKFMVDCLDCNCPEECKSTRFLRELEEKGEAILTEAVGATAYTSHARRNR